ncbi:MAG: AarF/ABC1/UbiB kinase family protein [Deltaproteobacteria bacterium]|nr:AarF/ABC1/UbiB kinase family protein [Deltaproteobacteria bacterium]MBW2420180.1 AarF/ABC1/UbiB kinase family protein [Deltaproteobacteria bacterium]
MAGEFALGGVTEGAKRLVQATPVDAAGVFLSVERAQKLARRLSHMRGAAMKLGQLLSLEGDDLLPPEFAEALAVLRATADAMPVSQVRRVMGHAYGKGWEERFREFDFEPLAAASIGQVHGAVTADGREIALKIQYPGVARSIDSDVDNLASLLRVTRILPVEIDISAIIDEAKSQLKQEADYLREAEHLTRFRALVADEPGVWVPAVHEDLTTKRVLAMDRAFALPIEELRSPDYPQSVRDQVGVRLQRLMFRELFEFRFVQTDPNFANYLYAPETDELVLLDFGSARDFSSELIDQYTRICRGMITEDRDEIHRAAVEIGYLGGEETGSRLEAFLDLILLAGEPLRHEGVYDFAESSLTGRAREKGFDLVFRQGFLRAPPPATIFLHRKLAGTFLLCAHIRSRVDTRALALSMMG